MAVALLHGSVVSRGRWAPTPREASDGAVPTAHRPAAVGEDAVQCRSAMKLMKQRLQDLRAARAGRARPPVMR